MAEVETEMEAFATVRVGEEKGDPVDTVEGEA